MAFKLEDFVCKDCQHTFEILLDSREPEQVKCVECGSINCEKVLGQGTGNKTHGSWARWRV